MKHSFCTTSEHVDLAVMHGNQLCSRGLMMQDVLVSDRPSSADKLS